MRSLRAAAESGKMLAVWFRSELGLPMTLKSRLAGQDGPTQRALPADEFLHPIPLAALLFLAANDWWLKPSEWAPPMVTGKLSDVAGLVFFPLLLTATFDSCALLAHRLGLRNDFTLRRWKAALAIGLTGLVFGLVKLSSVGNELALDGLRLIRLEPHIVLDPSDLLALPILVVPWLVARSVIARVPLGRVELILGRLPADDRQAGALLADVVACGAEPVAVESIAKALNSYVNHPSTATANALRDALAEVRTS